MDAQTSLNLDATLMDFLKVIGMLIANFGWSGTVLLFIFVCWKNGWKLPWNTGGQTLKGENLINVVDMETRLLKRIDDVYKKLADKIDRRANEQKEIFKKHEEQDEKHFAGIYDELNASGKSLAKMEGRLEEMGS
jgi:hypothetical protein